MKHLVLSGTPKERGLQHGSAWAKDIHELAQIRKTLLKEALKGWSDTKIHKLVVAHLEVLKKETELWEEFSGIAEGAKISPEDLMVLNNHTDLRDFGEGDFEESFFECSCFAFKKEERVIAGQTWDMHASALPYVGHLSVKKEHETQEIFTLTGCLGLTGVSPQGTGIFINNLRSKDLKIGLAWPAVVRKLLDTRSLEEAEKTLQAHLPSAGRNFLTISAKGGCNFEVSAKGTARAGNLNDGYLFHTNHYLSHLKDREELNTRSQTTLKRYAYLQALLPQLSLETLDVERVCQALFMKDTQNIVCLPVPPENAPHASATCGGLVYDFEKRSGVSFLGLYSKNDHLPLTSI